MSTSSLMRRVLLTSAVVIAMFGAEAPAEQPPYPKPIELPNPYRLVEGWPKIPKSMNGRHWGEVIRVHVHSDELRKAARRRLKNLCMT